MTTTLESILVYGFQHERQDWLDAHHNPRTLSASQVAAVVGQDPYTSAFTLYQMKQGAIPWPETTRIMEHGHAMEPLIAKWFREDSGREVYDPGDHTIWNHADYPWLFATPDRFQVNGRGVGVLELKTTEGFTAAAADYKSGEVPLNQQIQVQVQMACIGVEYGSLSAAIGRAHVFFDLDRHEAAIQAILAECERFMSRLVTGDPPPADASANTLATLKALHPDDSGEEIYLPDDALEWVNDLDASKAQAKTADEIKKAAEIKLREAMGANTYGVLPDGRKVSLKTTEKAAHQVAACKYRTLRITGKQEG